MVLQKVHFVVVGVIVSRLVSFFCTKNHFNQVNAFFAIIAYKTTTILLDGKRVKLQLWDTSGQGRFCTIIRSYSRGAQGVILVYDITNKWSFDGIDRWLKEVEEHAPGVPKVLVGNRLHLAFKRQVAAKQAELYASRNKMACFEISPLCDFNIRESFCELARMALHRNGMERIWRSNKGNLFICYLLLLSAAKGRRITLCQMSNLYR